MANGDYLPFPEYVSLYAGQDRTVLQVTVFRGANRNHKVKLFVDPSPIDAYGVGKAQSKVFLTDLP